MKFNQLFDLRYENTKIKITKILHTNEKFNCFIFCNIIFVKNEIICLIIVKYNFLFKNKMNLFEKYQNHIEHKKNHTKMQIQFYEIFNVNVTFN